MDFGEYMRQEEERLLIQARADIARDLADPVLQASILKRLAEREAEPEPPDEEVEPEDDGDEPAFYCCSSTLAALI